MLQEPLAYAVVACKVTEFLWTVQTGLFLTPSELKFLSAPACVKFIHNPFLTLCFEI